MRCAALTTLFFALFALFSTMAYAAPVSPQGAMLKRQCSMPDCRDATNPSTPAGSTDRFTMISNIITNLIALMGTNDSPSNTPQSSTTVVTASSTSAAPASDPTGV